MDNERDLYVLAAAGRISRRDLLKGAALLGLSGSAVSALLAACSSPAATTPPSVAAVSAAPSAASAAPASAPATPAASRTLSGALSLYSSTDTAQQVADAFAKATGVKVNNYNDDAGVVLARIEAEAGHPQADVYLLSDAEGTAGLGQQGRLQAYLSPARSTMSSLALQVSDTSGLFTAAGLSGAGPFTYNTKKLTAATAPKDWPDLLDPRFKDQIAMTDPAFSGPSYGAIFGILQRMGDSAGWTYIQGLFSNGMKVFKTNTPTLAAVTSGGRSIALAQDSATYYDVVAQSAPLAVAYPTSGTVLQGDVIGIEAKASNLDAAQAFVDYVLSAAGQTTEIGDAVSGKGVSGDAWIIPVQPGVAQNSARISSGINWTIIDLQQAASQEASIKGRFKSLAGS
ncbi:MAG: ABC transporter substrate-binding protein [Candidatus Limnocylindrales bacterium]